MFSTCLHCHSALGSNDLIEHFPIGRRLAFDSVKGRLWVVCLKCRRWNLTPLEERWEAIEECERLYRGTPLRASTDNIGLACLADGLDVVRIGAPHAPEMAAWRYAREFGRRWIQNGIPLAFLAGGGFQGIQYASNLASNQPAQLAVLTTLLLGACGVRFSGNRVRVALPTGKVEFLSPLLHRHVSLAHINDGWGVATGPEDERAVITGPAAVPALRAVMTARNFAGADKSNVGAAVSHLAAAKHPDRFIQRLAVASESTGIRQYPPDIALALEMALHEGTERRALDGELALLRDEWELAEEIAGIADDMLLPEPIRVRLATIASSVRQ